MTGASIASVICIMLVPRLDRVFSYMLINSFVIRIMQKVSLWQVMMETYVWVAHASRIN